MLQPPSLTSLLRYPVTVSLAAIALAVTGLWWSGGDIDWLVMNGQVWAKWELWRALTCTLPHVNIFHLAFNLYWLWLFGTLIERVYGHLRFAGIVFLLALGSSMAEFSLLYGGVGLSGVGYGLWGLLWVLEQRDARFAGTVDRQTTLTFVAWFFLCIALTVTDVMPVANVAHGVGAGLGALVGLASSSQGALKWKSRAGLAVTLLLVAAGSTVLWPWINQSKYAEPEVERAGVEALQRGDNANAKRLLEISVRMNGAPARAWFNLGIAYQRLGLHADALAAYEHAARMPDATSDVRKTAQIMKEYLTRRKERP